MGDAGTSTDFTPRGKAGRAIARFRAHKGKCQYPLEHCACGAMAATFGTEAYRRQRDADLALLGSGRVGRGVRPGQLVNERRREVRKVKQQLNLSPRQMKKLKRAMKREQEEVEARQRAMEHVVATGAVDLATVPAGMTQTESGLVVPA